jgi:hypothetical protein
MVVKIFFGSLCYTLVWEVGTTLLEEHPFKMLIPMYYRTVAHYKSASCIWAVSGNAQSFLSENSWSDITIPWVVSPMYPSKLLNVASPTSLTLSQPYWLSSLLLITSHRAHPPLYKLCNVLLAFFVSWTSWPLKMGPVLRCETSVKDYHATLHYIPEHRSRHNSVECPCSSDQFCAILIWL